MFIVNESNWQTLIADAQQTKHGRGLKPPTAEKASFGGLAAAKPMADVDLIPRAMWPDLIADRERNKTWLVDAIADKVPVTDQDGLPYCWVYCAKQCVEVARYIQNHGYIAVSATSVGGPIVNWRQVGGWPEDAIRRFAEVGACRESLTSGTWSLSPSKWNANWYNDCQNFRIAEWDDGSFTSAANRFDAQMTLTLLGRVHTVEFTWWSHAIAGGYAAKNLGNGRFALLMRNNWGEWGETVNGGSGYVWMEEGKGTSDALYAPRLVTPYDV